MWLPVVFSRSRSMNPLTGPAPTPSFPDRILATVFSYLATDDLVKAQQVHPYWKHLVRATPARSALTDPSPRLLRRYYKMHNQITVLDIALINLQYFQAICGLLPLFLPTLVELGLYFYSHDVETFPFQLLWGVLRSPAPALVSLCLKGDWRFQSGDLPAGPFLLGGKQGRLRHLILGGFRPLVADPRGCPVKAFGDVHILDIAAHALATVVATKSQYGSLRQITVHDVTATTMELDLPDTARKVNVNFAAGVGDGEAATWLQKSKLEKMDEVFATKGGAFLLGAFGERDIIGLGCVASGSIFRFSTVTHVDNQCKRTALVAPEEVQDMLQRLLSIGKLDSVAHVRLEGGDAMRLLPCARLDRLPKLSILELVVSFQDLRSSGNDSFLVELFDNDTSHDLPRLNGVRTLKIRGKRGFGVTVDNEHVSQFIERVTPAVKKLLLLNVTAIGDFELPANVVVTES